MLHVPFTVFVYLLGRQLTDGLCFGGASLHPAYLMAWGIPMAPKPSKDIIWWCNHSTSESTGKTTLAIFSSQPVWKCIFLPQWFGGLWLWLGEVWNMVKLKTQQTRHVAGEFDAITCLDGRLVVHDARMHPDMVKLLLGPTESASANHCLVVDQRWGPQVLMEPQHYTSIEHLKFAGVEIYLFQDGFNPIILPSLNHSLHHRSLVFPSFQVYEPPRLRLRRHLWGVGQQRGGLRGHGAAAGAGRAGGEAGDGDDVARLWLGCGGWDGDGEKLYINYIYHFWGGWWSISHLLFTRGQKVVTCWDVNQRCCCLLELWGCGWILSHISSLISFSNM